MRKTQLNSTPAENQQEDQGDNDTSMTLVIVHRQKSCMEWTDLYYIH